jgi:hypothetical protein
VPHLSGSAIARPSAVGRWLVAGAACSIVGTFPPRAGPPGIGPSRKPSPRWSSQDETMPDFSMRMKNRFQFSSCEAPHTPTTGPHEERLAVELCGDLLTITELDKDCGLGNRIYAQRTLDLPGASTFAVLPQLPSRIRDGSFFPALGTVAVFHAADGAKRRLRAVGTHTNNGYCRGWIFDAEEI